MQIREKILIVEDDGSIRKYMRMILREEGYEVILAQTGEEALAVISSHCPDLIILDLGLPDMDGGRIIRDVRKWTNLPILVVSARSHEEDKIAALDQGADDYITKPFSSGELLARTRVALRHARTAVGSGSVYSAGGLCIDYDRHQVTIDGEEIHLTQNEYRILSLISRYSGKVLTYDYIMKELWGPGAGKDNQILRVNMANIRRKIEKNPAKPEYIFTEVGVGYRMIEGE